MRITGRDPRTGDGIAVVVEAEHVAAIERTDAPDDVWLAPGLVDLQVNGFAGIDINGEDVTAAAVAELVRALHRVGVTTMVPTVVTAPEERVIASLRAIAAARRGDPLVAHAIPYAHVEGPFISGQDGPRGAHDPAFVRAASIDELERWIAVTGAHSADAPGSPQLVGMVTVSPHDEAALSFVAAATRLGVRCAVGHTHATPEQITRAAEAGATLATHLGNGAHAVLPRHPNYLWSQLAEDRLHAGFIADGLHLSADTFRAMLRAKGVERAHLVSDSVALAGMPPGRYRAPVGGEVELHADGRLSYADTSLLAGATRSLADGVATAAAMAGLPLATALRLATANPGRFTGGRGTLRPGAVADLVTFTWQAGDTGLGIRQVVTRGRTVRAD